jgi:excisionase family DNA binding protein
VCLKHEGTVVTKPKPEELSTREAAQLAGLSREQLLRRVERGEIKARYVDGRWLVSRQSVIEYNRLRRQLVASLEADE